MSEIWVQVQDLDAAAEGISRFSSEKVDPAKLKKKLEEFVAKIGSTLDDLPDTAGKHQLASVTLSVGISTGFELGIVTGATANISLTFQKSK